LVPEDGRYDRRCSSRTVMFREVAVDGRPRRPLTAGDELPLLMDGAVGAHGRTLRCDRRPFRLGRERCRIHCPSNRDHARSTDPPRLRLGHVVGDGRRSRRRTLRCARRVCRGPSRSGVGAYGGRGRGAVARASHTSGDERGRGQRRDEQNSKGAHDLSWVLEVRDLAERSIVIAGRVRRAVRMTRPHPGDALPAGGRSSPATTSGDVVDSRGPRGKGCVVDLRVGPAHGFRGARRGIENHRHATRRSTRSSGFFLRQQA